MQYTEDFKRGIVRALIASGMSRKEFADKAEIGVGTLKRWVAQYKDEEVPKVDRKEYWDSKYRYDVIDEVEREARQRRKKKVKKATSWHRYGSSAGRYE